VEFINCRTLSQAIFISAVLLKDLNLIMHNFIIGPCDTDSISFCKPDMSPFTPEEQQRLIQEINDISPEWMDWDADGYYDACLVLKAKNYILVENGKYKYRGSSLKDTNREPAVREMLQTLIKDIIENESKDLVWIYEKYIKEAANIQDITRWQNKKTITKSVLEPERMNEQKVLDAINEAVTIGISPGYQEGDKVWLYTAIEGQIQARAKGELIFFKDGRPKMIDNCILRDVRLWKQDHDTFHYIERVYKTVEILANVIDMNIFIDYTLKSNQDKLKDLTCAKKCDKLTSNAQGLRPDSRYYGVRDCQGGNNRLPAHSQDI